MKAPTKTQYDMAKAGFAFFQVQLVRYRIHLIERTYARIGRFRSAYVRESIRLAKETRHA